MEPTALSKVLVRLPNLITLFFSLTLVTGFRLLNDRFHWNTSPTFDITVWNDVLVLVSFLTTLLFIVTAWLGFSVLIERVPYQGSFNRFLFDTARFSALFPLLMWSFLAESPSHFQVFVWGLATWHLVMAIWYLWPVIIKNTSRTGHSSDMLSHVIISGIYYALGLAYYLLIATKWDTAPNQSLRIGLVLVTMAVIAFWSVNRLRNLEKRLVNESAPKQLTT
ncbi:hypothetical protein [Spirosoma endbachense]|uniref:Uncharacterized protein n=1 Tax=Spirosoma endbachense TaxID=2666025 RepID=A0A6P1VX87_9BACT|nr:hypothetical protein [Spirosoma endbachense]QHV95976.1 hypothetical protein GJR95_13585 [Spirosoma endbachense]